MVYIKGVGGKSSHANNNSLSLNNIMNTETRRQLLQQVTELTNRGEHLRAQVLYDMVMQDYRNSQAR